MTLPDRLTPKPTSWTFADDSLAGSTPDALYTSLRRTFGTPVALAGKMFATSYNAMVRSLHEIEGVATRFTQAQVNEYLASTHFVLRLGNAAAFGRILPSHLRDCSELLHNRYLYELHRTYGDYVTKFSVTDSECLSFRVYYTGNYSIPSPHTLARGYNGTDAYHNAMREQQQAVAAQYPAIRSWITRDQAVR